MPKFTKIDYLNMNRFRYQLSQKVHNIQVELAVTRLMMLLIILLRNQSNLLRIERDQEGEQNIVRYP